MCYQEGHPSFETSQKFTLPDLSCKTNNEYNFRWIIFSDISENDDKKLVEMQDANSS